MRRLRFPYPLPLLSGLLIGTSYIPFPPWALFFCFVPLWRFWLREGAARRIAWGGWLAQFVFGLVGFHWVAYTAREFGGMPWPAALLVLLLFCAFGHLFFVLAGLAFALLRSRLRLDRWAQIALLPFVTALCWRYVPMLFPWNLGYPWLGARLPAFQLAEYAGFEGLGLATLLLNALLLAAWEYRKERTGTYLLAGAAGLLLLLNGAGWIAGNAVPAPDAYARILAVQGDIGNLQKVSARTSEDARAEIALRYFRLTLRGLGAAAPPGPDVIVWPESAFPYLLPVRPADPRDTGALGRFVGTLGIPLVTGAPGYDEATGRKTNSLFFFGRDGAMADAPYTKTRLLMFGEYVPFSDTFPGLRRWFPWAGNFERGAGPAVRRIAGLRLGPQICYEGLFPEISRGSADRGAQLFVNVTNDSWFGTTAEPYQHLFMTLARGIEFRRPVLRATNTGISAAMTADGNLLSRSPLRAEWTHLYQVPYRRNPDPTFFQAYGYRLLPAVLWLATAFLLLTGRSRPSRRDSV